MSVARTDGCRNNGCQFPNRKRLDVSHVTTPKALDGFAEFAEKTLADWDVPGAAIAVVQDNRLIYAEGFGFRNVQEQLKVSAETVFGIGSSTKAFTSMSLALMVDDEKLDWDTPVRRYLPHFELQDEVATQRLTLRDMACHRSGLPRHDLMWYNAPFSREELLDRLRYLEPSKDFRTTWQYQNHLYMTCGYVAGKVNHSSWEELVSERIFKPLEMSHSNFSVLDSQQTQNYALPYEEKEGNVQEIPFRDISTIGPAGSINSTVLDMANWLLLHLNGGVFNEQRLVSERNLTEMHTAQMACQLFPWKFKETPVMNYGMGWFIEPYRGHHCLHHGGNIDGFSALVSFLPEEKIGVVVLTNLNSTMSPTVLTNGVFDRLLGLAEIDWSGRLQREIKKIKTAGEEHKQQLRSERKEGTALSHPLADYTGSYVHPGYGTLTVTQTSAGQLAGEYNGMHLSLRHYHYDSFEVHHDQFDVTLIGSFATDAKGRIHSLSLPLESTLAHKGVVFMHQE